jgi:hypothetical protein
MVTLENLFTFYAHWGEQIFKKLLCNIVWRGLLPLRLGIKDAGPNRGN